MTAKDMARVESELNSFDLATRTAALNTLTSRAQHEAILPPARADAVNMHCHSFFSFNAFGYSPSALAWLGRQRGFGLMGIVDFDVLEGVDEFLFACERAGIRGTAGIETRVFVPEYASQEVNSPGEPGVCYHMGIGFPSGTVPDHVAPILADLAQRAAERNQQILARVNAYLAPVTIDYAQDVLPLTNGSYRNHCPFCLHSKHVDIAPGDRQNACGGPMAPVGLAWKSGKGLQVRHRCTRCGDETVNRIAEGTAQPDDIGELTRLPPR